MIEKDTLKSRGCRKRIQRFNNDYEFNDNKTERCEPIDGADQRVQTLIFTV